MKFRFASSLRSVPVLHCFLYRQLKRWHRREGLPRIQSGIPEQSNLNKDTKTITIQHDTTVLLIKYTDQTKYTYRNQPGSSR